MLLKNHLDMIGRNEPVQRKARFWQSYVRALKGTDDMRAPEPTTRPRGLFRPLLADFPELSHSWPLSKSIYDEPSAPSARINVPGYRYLPVSRETYGYSPRNLYPGLPYTAADRYRPESWVDPQMWRDRLARHDPLGPAAEHWLHPLRGRSPSPTPSHARARSASPLPYPLRAGSLPPLERERAHSPPPRRAYSPPPAAPSERAPLFNYAGQPLYTRGGLTRRPLSELFEPLPWLPMSRISRDPWWWEYPELRPYVAPWSVPSHAPFYLRDSYLSPVKRSYLWSRHPIRPFGAWWESWVWRDARWSAGLPRSPNAPHLPVHAHRLCCVHLGAGANAPSEREWSQLHASLPRLTALRALDRTQGRAPRLRLRLRSPTPLRASLAGYNPMRLLDNWDI